MISLWQAGLPEGVLNVVNGYGDAGMHIASHMDVDKVVDSNTFSWFRGVVC